MVSMLMVRGDVGLGNLLDVLARLGGYRTAGALAEAMREAGYTVSQQAISNYRREQQVPPAGFIVCFSEILNLSEEQRVELLNAWLEKNPDVRDLYDMMRRLPL